MNNRLNEPIIKSLIDSDLYKFTMQYAVCKLFPTIKVKYKFIDRNNTVYPEGFDIQMKKQIEFMKYLHLTKREKYFMQEKLGSFLPNFYLDFLEGYQYDPSEVNVWLDDERHLHIEIEGFMYRNILWEVPLLALVSELFYIMTDQIVDIYDDSLMKKDLLKCQKMTDYNAYFSDFGTRRRFSYENQKHVVELFKKSGSPVFVGTSNIYLAYLLDTKAIGTHAHEWFMLHAALYGYKLANKLALESWVKVYNGSLGTALTDTYTTDNFLSIFDSYYARLFDGVRQDSGNEFEFTDKFQKHYESLKIDPLSKTVIFSNALTVDKAVDIKEYCKNRIRSSFGIGTFLTNDVGVKPTNIVIKLSQVFINGIWVDTVKLSDDLGKNTGVSEEVNLCKTILKIK
jgi:nicotinate phosphoribosyltransferase